jgi:hypothetical protein
MLVANPLCCFCRAAAHIYLREFFNERSNEKKSFSNMTILIKKRLDFKLFSFSRRLFLFSFFGILKLKHTFMDYKTRLLKRRHSMNVGRVENEQIILIISNLFSRVTTGNDIDDDLRMSGQVWSKRTHKF